MGRGRQVINVSTFSVGTKTDQQDFEPVYSLKGTISQKVFRKFMSQALDEVKGYLIDRYRNRSECLIVYQI